VVVDIEDELLSLEYDECRRNEDGGGNLDDKNRIFY